VLRFLSRVKHVEVAGVAGKRVSRGDELTMLEVGLRFVQTNVS